MKKSNKTLNKMKRRRILKRKNPNKRKIKIHLPPQKRKRRKKKLMMAKKNKIRPTRNPKRPKSRNRHNLSILTEIAVL